MYGCIEHGMGSDCHFEFMSADVGARLAGAETGAPEEHDDAFGIGVGAPVAGADTGAPEVLDDTDVSNIVGSVFDANAIDMDLPPGFDPYACGTGGI